MTQVEEAVMVLEAIKKYCCEHNYSIEMNAVEDAIEIPLKLLTDCADDMYTVHPNQMRFDYGD